MSQMWGRAFSFKRPSNDVNMVLNKEAEKPYPRYSGWKPGVTAGSEQVLDVF
jgi:hypothetical protein